MYLIKYGIIRYSVPIMFMLNCKTLMLLLRWDMRTVTGRFGGRGLRGRGRVNSVIIDVIT